MAREAARPCYDPAGPDHALRAVLQDLRTGRWMAMRTLLAETTEAWRWTQRTQILAAAAAGSDVVRAWLAEEPDCAHAAVMRARVGVERALRARREGHLRAHELWIEAWDAAQTATGLAPRDPVPWICLLALAQLDPGQRWAEHRAAPPAPPLPPGPWELLAEAAARDPYNREAHHRVLQFLYARDGGREGPAAAAGTPRSGVAETAGRLGAGVAEAAGHLGAGLREGGGRPAPGRTEPAGHPGAGVAETAVHPVAGLTGAARLTGAGSEAAAGRTGAKPEGAAGRPRTGVDEPTGLQRRLDEASGYARWAAGQAPAGSALHLLPLYVRVERHRRLGERQARWTTETAALEARTALTSWFEQAPADRRAQPDLNHLAHALWSTGQYAAAAAVFEAIGPYFTPPPWLYRARGRDRAVDVFTAARDRCRIATGPTRAT
ncbi:hypothetical protein [Streptomyces sp. NEAU-sy36]|uniref:hypothetical protein n=1 Tax=unclassified Streptomyces TaxID=2593676 RepID=UPI0035A5F018